MADGLQIVVAIVRDGGEIGVADEFAVSIVMARREGTDLFTKTNEVFEKIPEYVASFNPDERDMTKYIIGTFGALDTPLNPEAKGSRSMAAYLERLDYEEIQKERDEILAATPQDIRDLADTIASVLSDECLCVVGNEQAIRKETDMFKVVQGLCDRE